MTVIPPELFKVLSSKPSKREATKFPYKLNALIHWIGGDTQKENQFGIRFKPPNILEIKKKSLAAAFQVQMDSLILNFRRHGFTFFQKNDEWLGYIIPPNVSFDSFNDEEQSSPPELKSAEKTIKHREASIKSPMSNTIKIDKNNTSKRPISVGPNLDYSYVHHLRERWDFIVDKKSIDVMPIENFLNKAADVYQLRDIPKSEIFRLLSMMTFCSTPGFVSFNDFVLLATNFGEKNAVLPKFISLLKTIQKFGPFFRFQFKDNPLPKETLRVYFNPGSSYGFILVKPDGSQMRIYNDYNTPFFSDFLCDDKSNRYNSWDAILTL